VCYEIYSPLQTATPEQPQQLFARATTTIVLVDAKTTKPRRMTDVEREAIAPFVEESIQFKRRG
jgi:acyl-CoA thioester hydrolase